jgi:hypothetical protein
MAKTFAQNQKTAILADLQKLVDSGVLNSASADDFSKLNPLDRDWPGFPSAVVIPPAVTTSAYEDVANNLREYTWYIMVVTKPEDLQPTDPQYLEGLIDSILNVFDLVARFRERQWVRLTRPSLNRRVRLVRTKLPTSYLP